MKSKFHKKYTDNSIKLCRLLSGVLSLLFLLCACSDQNRMVSIPWSRTFVTFFRASEADTDLLQDGIQDLKLESKDDEITIQVEQSLSDENGTYISFQVYFSESMATDCFTEREDGYILPTKYCLLSGNIEKQAIESQSWEELKRSSDRYVQGGSSRIDVVSTDSSNRSISYLLAFTGGKKINVGDDITLILGDFVERKHHKEKLLSQGLYSFSWKERCSIKALNFTLKDKKQTLDGSAKLTPLALVVTLNHSAYISHSEGLNEIKIILRDGSEFSVESSGGGVMGMSGAGTWESNFRKILDVEQVQYLQIGANRFQPIS